MISSIRARRVRACMAAGAGAIVVVTAAAGNGARKTLSTCTGGTVQPWQIRSNGNVANVQSGRCRDPVGRGTGNGTRLPIYDCVAAASPTSSGGTRVSRSGRAALSQCPGQPEVGVMR